MGSQNFETGSWLLGIRPTGGTKDLRIGQHFRVRVAEIIREQLGDSKQMLIVGEMEPGGGFHVRARCAEILERLRFVLWFYQNNGWLERLGDPYEKRGNEGSKKNE